MRWAEYLFSFFQSLALARILSILNRNMGGEACYWIKGKKEEKELPSVNRLHVSCLTHQPLVWELRQKSLTLPLILNCLEGSSPRTPPPSHPSLLQISNILQVEGAAVYSFISHMAKRSAAFLNQRITLSFRLKTMTHPLVQQLDDLHTRLLF